MAKELNENHKIGLDIDGDGKPDFALSLKTYITTHPLFLLARLLRTYVDLFYLFVFHCALFDHTFFGQQYYDYPSSSVLLVLSYLWF
jgi:hypothetical protein